MLIGTGAGPTPVAAQARADAPPNMLFLLVDDLGWTDLGSYGNDFIETPSLDRLSAQGMRFTNAYAASPVCAPTRASIQTGQYPARLGLSAIPVHHQRPWAKLTPPPVDWPLSGEATTLAEALARAGYTSTHIGKWNIGWVSPALPEDQGYVAPPAGDAERLHPAYRADVQHFARQNPHKDVGPYTLRAIQFIENNQDRPFLCFLSYHSVHLPLEAREALVEKYRRKAKTMDTFVHSKYAAMVETLDASVGLLMRALEALDLADETVVVLFSDNGGVIQIYHNAGPIVTSNAPLRSEKGTLYEGGIRVPLIVKWPGVTEPGSVSDVPVISNDFFPTLVEMAGLQPAHAVDGASLVPLLRQQGPLERRALFWHYPYYHHATPAAAVRVGPYKLIEWYETGRLALYDLSEDLGERHNLAEERPEKARALQARLHRWQQAVGASPPAPNPHYNPSMAHIWGVPVLPGEDPPQRALPAEVKCQWVEGCTR